LYKLFLTLRYLRSRRIAYFAMAAVTLCVAMVLIVLSVMGGWLDQVQKRARGLLGDIIVDNRDYSGFPLYQEFIDEISGWPEIVKATPVLHTYGLIRFPGTGQYGTARVVGVRLQDIYAVNAFKSGLFYEKFYPGTTSLAEQQQPLLGFDPAGPTLRLEDGREVEAIRLPAPYQEALEAARRASEAAGAALDDSESVESELNKLLRANGYPIIPGVFALNDGDFTPKLDGNPLPGLIIGRDILATRKSDGRYERYEPYARGMVVTLTLWAASVKGTVDPIPIKQPFRYADDSRTGIYDIDSQHVYCDFELLQKLLHMDEADRVDADGAVVGRVPGRCSQLQVKIAPGADPAELCRRMEEAMKRLTTSDRFQLDLSERRLLTRVDAMTWEESQAHIIGPVKKEKVLVTILFGIISLVAVALVLCILYMIVLQKTRDIGIVKSVGGSSAGVGLIFVAYGAAVGVVGAALGSLIGALIVTNINEIQDFLISLNPAWRVWDLKVYSFDHIPHEVAPSDLIWVVLVAVFASTLGSLGAAWRAGAMQPVEAIRYE
jgi:lipoprotein-releasing system permease protein